MSIRIPKRRNQGEIGEHTCPDCGERRQNERDHIGASPHGPLFGTQWLFKIGAAR